MKITKMQLIAELKNTIRLLEANDSYEGSIYYNCLETDKDQFEVTWFIRHGNSHGQGFVYVLDPTTELED